MGDTFFVYESTAGAPDADRRLEIFHVRRARFLANVAPPPLGQRLAFASHWEWHAVLPQEQDNVPFAMVTINSLLDNSHVNRSNTIDIELDAENQVTMTDQDAAAIFQWAEQLCSATSVERTPWRNQAERMPTDRYFASDAQLWKATFARVEVVCNPNDAAVRLLVVPRCRRAVVCGYVPCSHHMWLHPATTEETQRGIAKRWGSEALVRRLVAAFQSPAAASANDASFGAVRRLLSLYLYVAAITSGDAYPNFTVNDDFRTHEGNPYRAVFVKDLMR